jgi:2-enoate reductase
MDGGRVIEEGLEVAKLLEKAGADALDIDSGCYETWYYPHPPTTMKPGFDIELSEMVKAVVSIPVIASGKLGYPELAEKVISENKADFVSLGRPLLADPDWPEKVRQNKLGDIRYCLGCHEGCLKRIFEHKHISCAVNPAAGNEKRMTITPAGYAKRVLVVGGGVAGMEAARVCALRGHQVELWESKDYLGGNFKTALLPEFKNDYKLYIEYLTNQLELNNVPYVLNKTATESEVIKFNPDVVFMATGSDASIPKIPGIDKDKVTFAKEVFEKHIEIGSKVIIIGGGIIGLETALLFAQQGKEVTILECQVSVGSNMFLPNRLHILKLLQEYKVNIITEVTINMIDNNTVHYSYNNRKNSLVADSIVIATGLSVKSDLSKKLMENDILLYKIGDCQMPRKVIDAVWEAYKTARLI